MEGLPTYELAPRIRGGGHFPDAATLASYAGLVPALRRSGNRTPLRAGQHPLGNARLRRGRYLATLSTVRFKPWLRGFYQRLVDRGKPKLLALTAASRKPLTAIYSVAKRREPFTLVAPSPEFSAR